MAISSADLPSASLPEETSQIGDASQMGAARKAIESQGTGRRTQPGASSGGPPPAAGGPATPPAGPVQPQPRQPLTPQDLRPGGPVFSNPQLAPRRGWQDEVRTWAAHPSAGPWLGAVNRHLQQGGSTAPVPGRVPPPGQPPPQ